MTTFLQDTYSVWWADLRILRHLWQRFLITSLMSPMLYLLAFGYGLGRWIEVEGTDYLKFLIPGIIALSALNTAYNGSGFKLNVDRLYNKSFDEMLMVPIRSFSLILGKSMVGVFRGLIVSVCFLVIGLAVSSMNVTPLFLLVLVASCFMFSFMGVLCALLAKTHVGMATFTSVVVMPMTFLGGTFFSINQVPGWLKGILYVLPLTHTSNCLRAEALGTDFPWLSFLGIAGFLVVFFCACLVALRRSSV